MFWPDLISKRSRGPKKSSVTKTITHPLLGEITLSRTRRSTRISLSVRPDGRVRLSFPWLVTQRQAIAFLEEKQGWIVENRARMARQYVPHEPIPKAAIEALRAQAKRRLPEVVEKLARQHGFKYGNVRIKALKSKWGSCTVRGDLNLSLFLMRLPDHLIDYVVLHELCHTVHLNHSANFHALLDRVTQGRHRALNRELRKFTIFAK